MKAVWHSQFTAEIWTTGFVLLLLSLYDCKKYVYILYICIYNHMTIPKYTQFYTLSDNLPTMTFRRLWVPICSNGLSHLSLAHPNILNTQDANQAHKANERGILLIFLAAGKKGTSKYCRWRFKIGSRAFMYIKHSEISNMLVICQCYLCPLSWELFIEQTCSWLYLHALHTYICTFTISLSVYTLLYIYI